MIKGWQPPLCLIDLLKAAVATVDAPPAQYFPHVNERVPEIRILTSGVKIRAPLSKKPDKLAAAWAAVDSSVATLFLDFAGPPHAAGSAWMPGTVMVNAPLSDFADIIATVGNVVLLVQAKRYVRTPLQRHRLFAELHKMGHRDWRCCFAAWLVELQSLNEKVRTVFFARMSEKMPTGLQKELFECFFPPPTPRSADTLLAPAIAEAFQTAVDWVKAAAGNEVALREWLKAVNVMYTDEHEIFLRDSAWARKKRYFVVMAYGATPNDVDEVPADVLLLHAGPEMAPRNKDNDANETVIHVAPVAERLCSYYPFRFSAPPKQQAVNTAIIDAPLNSTQK